MSKNKELEQLTIDDLKVNRVYRAKKPRIVGLFPSLVNDRQIKYISSNKQHVETIDNGHTEKFLNWCKDNNELSFSEYSISKYELETDEPYKDVKVVMDYIVQYDSPTVKRGKDYPKISATKFLKFANEDVTEIMPNGEWATELPKKS